MFAFCGLRSSRADVPVGFLITFIIKLHVTFAEVVQSVNCFFSMNGLTSWKLISDLNSSTVFTYIKVGIIQLFVSKHINFIKKRTKRNSLNQHQCTKVILYGAKLKLSSRIIKRKPIQRQNRYQRSIREVQLKLSLRREYRLD